MKDAVHYRIRWDEPNEHLFDIEIRFRATNDETRLDLPAWRPGRYLIQNYAANVRQWSATGAGGRILTVRKTAKSQWTVASRAREEVTFRYRFFAGVLDAGSSFLDEREAYFNGSNLFMLVDRKRNVPHLLNVDAPADWTIETQLRRRSDGTFEAADYDALIDAPAIASPTLMRYTVDIEGVRVHLVFQNAEGVDVRQYVEPVRRIAAGHAQLFGGLPVDEYRFLYHVGDRWHGVEHAASCSIIVKRADLLGAKKGSEGYDHFLAVTSHEFFHLWNVKRILPKAFVPYDYSREAHTALLWVMEGVTSFFGEKMLLRTGLWSVDRYLEHLGKEITTLESIPAHEWLPVEQSSLDAWLQEPSQMHDKANGWISFYNKGEIVGALLDLEIRRRTDGARSLDDVMRSLWDRYGARGRGLEEDAFEKTCARVAGESMRDVFDAWVRSAAPLPYRESFASIGVEVVRKPMSEEPILGIALRSAAGRLLVDTVRTGSPAMRAGLLPGDEIVAVDGTRVSSEADVKRLVQARGERRLTILTARNDVLRTVRTTAAPDPREVFTLQPLDAVVDAVLAIRKQWAEG